jgi:protein-L-isoaspartate(D-aspartate) O-methyltransferase
MTPDFLALRRNMVDCQLRTYDVTDRAVLAAMDKVARELFVPEVRRAMAYLDQPMALDEFGAPGRALLAPMTSGRMLQTLDVQPGESFLDYASGTGYTAALAAAMGAHVTACEGSASLRAAARSALDQSGFADVGIVDEAGQGPYDLIFVNGACEMRPDSLAALLADGGRMVAVEGAGRSGRVMLYQKSGNVVGSRAIFDAAAPILAAFRRPPSFVL